MDTLVAFHTVQHRPWANSINARLGMGVTTKTVECGAHRSHCATHARTATMTRTHTDAFDDDTAPVFAPFFAIAGAGYAMDIQGTPEYRQMHHGWQAQWTIEDDPLQAHALSANPCVVYDITDASASAADVIDACERATGGGKVARCFAPDGADFAFVTFAEDAHAARLCADGVVIAHCGEEPRTVMPARIPAPALVKWRADVRARCATAKAA